MILSDTTIRFPDKIPGGIFAPLLKIQVFDVTVDRRIAIVWSEDDNTETVSFVLGVPPNNSRSPGVVLERVEGSYDYRVIANRPSQGAVSWLNLSSYRDSSGALVYGQDAEALFGRAQLGWYVRKIENTTVPVSSDVAIEVPSQAKIRYSSQAPRDVVENRYLFQGQSGFIYVESGEARDSTIRLLVAIMIGILAVLLLGSSDSVRRFESDLLRRAKRIVRGVGLQHLLAVYAILFCLTLGMSYLIGPSPRVNIGAITGPDGDYLYSLSTGPRKVVRSSTRSMELMLEFDVVDMVVIEDYKFEQVEGRWWIAIEEVLKQGIPVYVGHDTLELNEEFFEKLPVDVLPEGSEIGFLESELARIQKMKESENRLKLSWDLFMPLAIFVVVASLLTIALSAAAAGYLTLYLRERVERSVNRLTLSIVPFFVLFVLGVILYTSSSYFLKMPLGWHGPSGSGITVVSMLSEAFGGGNLLRALFALMGLGAVLVLFVSRRRIRISFSLMALFGVLSVFLLVATPLTAPTLFRVISGETPNTPPKDYFSRSSVNALLDVEYEIHESVAGLLMAILGEDSLETWLSRGMITSLALAGVFFTLSSNSGKANALVVPGLFLVIARLFARVGDLQIFKSLWTLPTALVLATLIVVAVRFADMVISGFSEYLRAHGNRGWALILFVILPSVTGAAILYYAAGTDLLLQVLLGWSLLVMAAISAANRWNWRQIIHRGEVIG
jgi:hypothetical protein